MSTTPAAPTSKTAQPILPGITRYSDLKNAAKPVNDKMGKTEFLTLFTTQLQNQNPLDPVNNEAFVAQLAQFSQLEASTNMSASLETMAKSMKSDRFMNGANLIGKQVTAPMGNARYEKGSTISGLVSIPAGADSVSLDVMDAQGKKIYSQTLGRQMPGDLKLSWNGATDAGEPAPSGIYKIVATVNSLGKITQTPISTPMTVKSVTYSPADDDLIVELEGGATVPLSQISRIDAPWVPPQSTSVAGGLNALPSGTAGSGTGSTPASALEDALKGLFKPGP
ncbi:MAG: flagellar hook assembly protein FlgD [Betaproteobacteria bacterium]